MGWLITLAVLCLLAIIPLGVSVIYDEDGPQVCIIAGLVKILLFPRPKKDKKPKLFLSSYINTVVICVYASEI